MRLLRTLDMSFQMATVRAWEETGMVRGRSQAWNEDLTLSKNHHTPSQALGLEGTAAPVPLT